jgi:hypothetical protein
MPRKARQKESKPGTASASLTNEIARLPQREITEEDRELLKWADESLHRDIPRAELNWSDDGVLQINAKGRWGRL